MRLSKLIEGIEKQVIYEGDWEREITVIATYSKEPLQSALFVCLQGNVDGHAYVEEAVKNGAVAVLTQKRVKISVPQIVVKDTREALAVLSSIFYGEPSLGVNVIGITGTNGKTTTSYMLSAILTAWGKRVGTIGTLGVRYLGKEYPCELTTPDPVFLQKTLREMADNGIEYVVMEVSAHALFYKKVAGVNFRACIASNVTQDHLDFFKDMDEYARVKSLLFLPERCPLAILNTDDKIIRSWARNREGFGAKTLTYGLRAPADAFAIIQDGNAEQTRCVLNVLDEVIEVTLSFVGEHNVYNALSAVSCAYALGIDAESIRTGFSRLQGVSGRLERVATYNGATVFVDFAHTPDGLKQSLSALKEYCKRKLICVFGCGGNRDKSKRSIMGKMVAETVDFSVLTADNPRYEDPLDIIADIEKGYREISKNYVIVPKREQAIAYAMERLEDGDILLVAGKGGEKYQEIMGIKYPFEDNAIIKDLVGKRQENGVV